MCCSSLAEIIILRQNKAISFMAGVYVFTGERVSGVLICWSCVINGSRFGNGRKFCESVVRERLHYFQFRFDFSSRFCAMVFRGFFFVFWEKIAGNYDDDVDVCCDCL